MTEVASDDNGCMAAVSAPIEKVEAILAGVEGYVVIANINDGAGGSTHYLGAAPDMGYSEYPIQVPIAAVFARRMGSQT